MGRKTEIEKKGARRMTGTAPLVISLSPVPYLSPLERKRGQAFAQERDNYILSMKSRQVGLSIVIDLCQSKTIDKKISEFDC